MDFLLECDNNGYLSSDVNTIREIIVAENNWNQTDPNNTEDHIGFRLISYGELMRSDPDINDIVPIGSLRFCDAVGAMQGARPVSALNVPFELRRYAGRMVYSAVDEAKLEELIAKYRSVFVKPNDRPKRFESVMLTEQEYTAFVKENEPAYFVSEKLQAKIVAEWRVFFWRHRIIGIAPYSLSKWVMPNDDVCRDIIHSWANAPTAGTLDIAVMQNGANIVIEAHPLISCGLYGFDKRELLAMHSSAWREHVSKDIA